MHRSNRRRAFTLSSALVLIAIIGFLVGILLVAVSKARMSSTRIQSVNNLKQIGLACHVYHDAIGNFPAGNDKNNFSALAHLLPYIEQQNVSESIDFSKPVGDKANDKARKMQIKIYLSPLDPQAPGDVGGTNYMFCAGSKPGLKDNDGVMCQDSAVGLAAITNGNGSANTVLAAETLRGDGGTKPVDVARQHVGLKNDALKGLKDDAGVKDWKDGKNIVGNRGASWMDGRFLQTTFSGNLAFNDEKPDVSCEGLGGYSAMRCLPGQQVIPVVYCDGHVANVPVTTKLADWQAQMKWK
jgi:prepilin-type processing-associated H-X9-DG protein